jgi:hypothetical protein
MADLIEFQGFVAWRVLVSIPGSTPSIVPNDDDHTAYSRLAEEDIAQIRTLSYVIKSYGPDADLIPTR